MHKIFLTKRKLYFMQNTACRIDADIYHKCPLLRMSFTTKICVKFNWWAVSNKKMPRRWRMTDVSDLGSDGHTHHVFSKYIERQMVGIAGLRFWQSNFFSPNKNDGPGWF